MVRNTGGNIRHVLRDIHVADGLFNIDEIAIIHHTDCGTLHFSEEDVRSKVRAYADKKHWAEIDSTVYGANAEYVPSYFILGLRWAMKCVADWIPASRKASGRMWNGPRRIR